MSKPIAQRALEIAGLAPQSCSQEHADAVRFLADRIERGNNMRHGCVALANVLVRLAYLDEQAAAADVDTNQASYKRSDGEASPPTEDKPECHHHRLTRDCRLCSSPAPSPGEDKRVSRELYESVVDQRDEARAELTRLKAENARLSVELKVMFRRTCPCNHSYDPTLPHENECPVLLLEAAQRSIASLEAELAAVRRVLSGDASNEQAAHEVTKRELATLRNDLTWERGWDLLRKAQMGAVVDAAGDTVEAFTAGRVTSSTATLARLHVALSALDASQPEPASEPISGGDVDLLK